MTFSKVKLLAAAAALMALTSAAAPASADTFRAAFYSGDASPGIVSIGYHDYRGYDGDRFDRMRYEQHRRAMFWHSWQSRHHRGFDHRMDQRFGDHGRFEH